MQKIIGPYEVLEQLGSGGMGVVYRPRDTRLQREVAIKVLPEGFLDPGTPGQATHERFLREARSASSLNHPNIYTVHDVGEHDGKPYLVMELLQGRTLKEVLRDGPLPLPQALEFAIQIARGLEEAHEAGIVHRDIKPANIFIVRKQQGTQQAKILTSDWQNRPGRNRPGWSWKRLRTPSERRMQAYHDFFNTWKDADPDLPQLAQAKAEFAALR